MTVVNELNLGKKKIKKSREKRDARCQNDWFLGWRCCSCSIIFLFFLGKHASDFHVDAAVCSFKREKNNGSAGHLTHVEVFHWVIDGTHHGMDCKCCIGHLCEKMLAPKI